MGNIVTPEQDLLPLPGYVDAATAPYPWWLNAALAIWALLALLCCWLLLLFLFLRYCCKWCRQRKYASKRKSLRQQFLSLGGAEGKKSMHVSESHRFTTAPLSTVPAYAFASRNEASVRDNYERRTIEDDFYSNASTAAYVAAGAVGAENEAFESGSEYVYEEEIKHDGLQRKSNGARLLVNGRHPITTVSDKSAGDITENIETNVQHNITKNYYINEEQNYFVQKDPAIEISNRQHDREIRRLPGPTVTTVDMAAKRVTDNTNWENADSKEDFDNQDFKQASSEIVKRNSSLFEQDVKYEAQPNIYTHQPVTPETLQVQNRKLDVQQSTLSDDGSTTSEMSGHDSESIIETVRVFTPRERPFAAVEGEDEDEDEYKTAGVDEVEFEIQDLVRLQTANAKSSDNYDDIVTSTSRTYRHLTPSLSSSSTLNNLMPANSQYNQVGVVLGNESKEATVTETAETQQVQTTLRQIGRSIGDSAFVIPLTSSATYNQGQKNEEQQNGNKKIIVPVSTSTVSYEEKLTLQYF